MKIRSMNALLAVAAAQLTKSLAWAQGGGAACDRACLENWVDRYLEAVIAADPARVPLGDDVRFTENGQRLEIGDGLWNSMKSKGMYRLFVADVPAGQVAFIGTINEDHANPQMDAPALLALRLKIEQGRIAEVEQFVARNADAANRVAALGNPHPVYLATIPPNQRMSRADLIATADKYFTGMQMNDGKGDYPFHERCDRIENGGRSTNLPTPEGQTRPDPMTSPGYSAQWSCLEQFQSGMLYFVSRIRDRRYVAVDQERGVVAAFASFDHMAGSTRNFTLPNGRAMTAGPVQPWTWEILEFFKIEDGRIAEIEAFLTRPPYGMQSGWSSWEDGLSDRARDVTGYTE